MLFKLIPVSVPVVFYQTNNLGRMYNKHINFFLFRRLFTLEGALLHGPEDIVDGGQYVACGHRRFILASYGESNQPARTQK